jgi:hypothetical protein
VFEFYPEYGSNPSDILVWCYQVLKNHEDKLAQIERAQKAQTEESTTSST